MPGKNENGTTKPYTKEDIIWEAVRRNEIYKQHFKEIQKQKNDYERRTFNGDFFLPSFYRWETKLALDPSINVLELRKMHPEKDAFADSHPYSSKNHKSKNSIISISTDDISAALKNILTPNKLRFENKKDPVWQLIQELVHYHSRRLIISLDPVETLKEEGHLQIDNLLKNKRKELFGTENIGSSFDEKALAYNKINIGKLNDTIRELEGYDQVVEIAQREGFYRQVEGVIAIEGNFNFKSLVNSIDENVDEEEFDKKLESGVKTIKNRYNRACQLIKNAPHFIFTPAQVKSQ